MNFITGQRYYSEGEPELGLGLIKEVMPKTLEVLYPEAGVTRVYGKQSSPIKRISFQVDDQILIEGKELKVIATREESGLLYYNTIEGEFSEVMLDSKIDLSTPLDKFFALNFDTQQLYETRYQSYLKKRAYSQFKHKGLLGARIGLLHHQAYLTSEISNRLSPKVLLSDEVGLGKTIEAGLILNSLILKEKVQKALIIVPDALTYQWFFELKFKFSLNFSPLSLNDELGIEPDDLQDNNFFIISMDRLLEDQRLQQNAIDMKFDTLIVDEAHRFVEGEELNILSHITEHSYSTIFLSATPKANGIKNFFHKLSLLEPNKFNDFNSFQKKEEHYKELIPCIDRILEGTNSTEDLELFFTANEINSLNNKDDIIKGLIDKHGTSRLFFRNTRDYLRAFDLKFPERNLNEYPISNDGKLNDKLVFFKKLQVLQNLLDEKKDEKVLLIVHAKNIAAKIYKSLKETTTHKLALFTSDQSLMERDRQAAFFAEEDGAKLLICTEIASEGRNFEFASHIFLFDIPKVPDLLEQRIGRLDRIGQKKTIQIHLPYIQQSFEEILMLWYKDVLGSFTQVPKDAYSFFKQHEIELQTLLQTKFEEEKVSTFIQEKAQKYDLFKKELQKGHDKLVDINSFNLGKAQEIINEVQDFTKDHSLKDYLNVVFDSFGVNFTELNSNSYFIEPSDTMLLPAFPALPAEGMSITFDREYALKRNDLNFMSFEHPIALNSLELFTNSELGNTALVCHQGEIDEEILIEFIFKLEALTKQGSLAKQFLPLTPIRVLLNSKGQDLTKKISKKFIDQFLTDYKGDTSHIKQIPKEFIKEFASNAKTIANKKAHVYITKAQEQTANYLKKEIFRLEELQKVNQAVSKEDIEELHNFLDLSLENIKSAKLELDALRFIIKS